jgi:hypothetical protein
LYFFFFFSRAHQIYPLYEAVVSAVNKMRKASGSALKVALAIDQLNTEDVRAEICLLVAVEVEPLLAADRHRLAYYVLRGLLDVHALAVPDIDGNAIFPAFVPDTRHVLEMEKLAYIFGWAVWAVATKSKVASFFFFFSFLYFFHLFIYLFIIYYHFILFFFCLTLFYLRRRSNGIHVHLAGGLSAASAVVVVRAR